MDENGLKGWPAPGRLERRIRLQLQRNQSSLRADHDHALDGLLRAVATALQPSRHTPLHFQIDSTGAAWQALTQAGAHIQRLQVEPSLLASSLEERVTRLLAGAPPVEWEWVDDLDDAAFGDDVLPLYLPSLSGWLGRFHECLCRTDAAAIDAFALYMQGCSHREIAVQLGLGLRLVDRLWAKIRQLWAEGAGTC